MEKEKLESLIIDYIDNKLNTVDRHKVEQELMTNTEAYKLYEQLKEVIQVIDKSSMIEPRGDSKAKFNDLLQQEINNSRKAKTVFFNPAYYRVAAAVALLVLGAGFGYWISKQHQENERLAVIERQLEAQKQAMLSLMHNDQSASQRIQGVNVAMDLNKVDDDVVEVLFQRMNEDRNSNVRLAALEALARFSDDVRVRKKLINSLSTQDDPVVQIALIQLLVKMKEKGVVNDLQKIVDDSETMQAVKDEAYSGILRLS